MLVSIEIFDWEVLHAVEHFAAHFIKEALRYLRHQLRLYGYQCYGKNVKSDEYAHHGKYL